MKKKQIVVDADILYLLSIVPTKNKEEQLRLWDILGEVDNNNVLILTPNEIEVTRLIQKYVDHSITPAHINSITLDIDSQLTEPFTILTKEEALGKFKSLKIYYDLIEGMTNTNLLLKGLLDIVISGDHVGFVKTQSSKKRCGGQGDILAGFTSLYADWSIKAHKSPFKGILMASILTRECSRIAFNKYGMSLTTTKIISIMPEVLRELIPIEDK